MIKEGKVVGVRGHKDVPAIKTQWAIIILLPVYYRSIGKLAGERAFWFGVVVDSTRIALCFGIGITDRQVQVPLTFGGIDLQGVVLRVSIASKLGDIRVTEIGAFLVRCFSNVSGGGCKCRHIEIGLFE